MSNKIKDIDKKTARITFSVIYQHKNFDPNKVKVDEK